MEWQRQSVQRDTLGLSKLFGRARLNTSPRTVLMPTERMILRGRVSVWGIGETIVNAGPGVVEKRISHISRVAAFDRSSLVFWEICGDANKTQISPLTSVK